MCGISTWSKPFTNSWWLRLTADSGGDGGFCRTCCPRPPLLPPPLEQQKQHAASSFTSIKPICWHSRGVQEHGRGFGPALKWIRGKNSKNPACINQWVFKKKKNKKKTFSGLRKLHKKLLKITSPDLRTREVLIWDLRSRTTTHVESV